MLPALLLGCAPGHRVLDTCASPGSKTMQVAALPFGSTTFFFLLLRQCLSLRRCSSSRPSARSPPPRRVRHCLRLVFPLPIAFVAKTVPFLAVSRCRRRHARRAGGGQRHEPD